MKHLNIKTDVTINKAELLAKLEANLNEHKAIVIEARIGYVEKARKSLEGELAKLRDGRARSINIHLEAPQDMSEAYRTVIEMLKMHTGDTIQLSASEFRMLVLDQWDWSSQFLMSNSTYSAMAMSKLAPADLDG